MNCRLNPRLEACLTSIKQPSRARSNTRRDCKGEGAPGGTMALFSAIPSSQLSKLTEEGSSPFKDSSVSCTKRKVFSARSV